MPKKSLLVILCIFTLAGCSFGHHEKLQGYVEGRFNYLASNYSGTLVKLLVLRGTPVKAGQLLAILDPEPQKAALDQANQNLLQAEAQYSQIKANLELAELTLSRNEILRKKNAVPQETLDTARTNRDTTQAQLQAANANLSAMRAVAQQAKWSYSQKLVIAPMDGEIFDNYYEIGDLVPANYPILGLLSPNNIYLIFFIPEPLLGKVKVGDPVEFCFDGWKENLSATIRYISPNTEYTPPVIYTQKSRRNLVYRAEAEVTPEVAKKLHPGQPVDVYLSFQ